MAMLKNISFDDLLDTLKKIAAAHEKEGTTLTFAQQVEKLVTFLPNISFKDFVELKLILTQHDYLRYKKFQKEHLYIEFDPTGTSPDHFPWWEIMLDTEDTTLETLKYSTDKQKYEKMREAKELNQIGILTLNGNYLMYRQLFLKKYGQMHPNYSARLDKIEAGLKALVPTCSKFLAKVIFYCYREKDPKMLELIMNRLTYLIEDKDLSHPSNIEYLERIKKLSNN